jgi:hypothetical protein
VLFKMNRSEDLGGVISCWNEIAAAWNRGSCKFHGLPSQCRERRAPAARRPPHRGHMLDGPLPGYYASVPLPFV